MEAVLHGGWFRPLQCADIPGGLHIYALLKATAHAAAAGAGDVGSGFSLRERFGLSAAAADAGGGVAPIGDAHTRGVRRVMCARLWRCRGSAG